MLIKRILTHSVIQNTFFLSLVKLLDLVLPLITIPYLTRMLSVEEFGALIICMATYNMANILTDFGFGISAPYQISKNRENQKYVNLYVTSVLTLKFFLSFLAISIIYIYLYFYSPTNAINTNSIFIIFGIVFCLSFQSQWFFLGIEKMKSITILASASKLSYFILIFTIVSSYKTLNSVLMCLLVSNIFALFFYILFMIREGYKPESLNFRIVYSTFIDGLSFFISRLSVGLSTTANGLVIGSILGVNAAALYGAAEKIYNAAMGLVMPISSSLYPYMARTKNHNILLRVVFLLVSLSIVGCYIFSYFSPWFFVSFFGEKYRESAYLFNYFLFLIPVNIASILLGYSAFAIVNKPKVANYTVIISSLIYLFLFLFIYVFNYVVITNILLLIIFVDVLTLFMRVFLFRKELKKLSYKEGC